MRTLVILFVFALVQSTRLLAADPIHSIKITNGTSFELVAKDPGRDFALINAYPLSDRAKPMMRERTRPNVEAADYVVGPQIRTKDAKLAIQQLLAQIATQTGRSLITVQNSNLKSIEPNLMLMALDANSVWVLLLTPQGTDVYAVSCAFVVDEKKN